MTSAGGRITAGVGANLIGQHAQDRNQEATCYVGNLDEQVKEELLWELMTQAGPVANLYMPTDRVTNKHRGHAFVEFKGEEDADYAIKVLNMVKVCGKPIRVNKASQDKKNLDVGANLFVGNLDADVDEKMLYDTFSAFGVIVNTPKIMRDPDSGVSKGFGFVSFDNFESSDAAVEAMHGQFLMNRAISVQYAFKKDTNERHGTPAERIMAQSYRMIAINSSRPNTMFATAPSQVPSSGPPDPSTAPAAAPPPPSTYHNPPSAPPSAPMQHAPGQMPSLVTLNMPQPRAAHGMWQQHAPPTYHQPPAWHGGQAVPMPYPQQHAMPNGAQHSWMMGGGVQGGMMQRPLGMQYPGHHQGGMHSMQAARPPPQGMQARPPPPGMHPSGGYGQTGVMPHPPLPAYPSRPPLPHGQPRPYPPQRA